MSKKIQTEVIEQNIFIIRGYKVMLSHHLAELYRVETKTLLQAVKRNAFRFPTDFMFQLTSKELSNLRSQFVTSSWAGTWIVNRRSLFVWCLRTTINE